MVYAFSVARVILLNVEETKQWILVLLQHGDQVKNREHGRLQLTSLQHRQQRSSNCTKVCGGKKTAATCIEYTMDSQ